MKRNNSFKQVRISLDINTPKNRLFDLKSPIMATEKLQVAQPEKKKILSTRNDMNFSGTHFFKRKTQSQQKDTDFCFINVKFLTQILYKMQVLEVKLECTKLTSESLIQHCSKTLVSFEESQKNKSSIDIKNLLGFKTKDKYYIIDYILGQPDLDMSFLKKQKLVLLPIFRESKNLQLNIKTNTNLLNFQLLYMIGMGGFSRVFLGKHLQNQKYYALKIIDKHFIVDNNKEEIIMNERQIMIQMKHPFIVNMEFAFQTKNYLIFAMEFCPGGDFFTHLKQLKILSENHARVYFLQICLALSHLHHNKIVYRDLKPENILLDLNGNMKIADFGLSKWLESDQLAHSFCGSSEYMSPEMIEKKGHSYGVDHYGLGALLYEMVFGFPPFYSQNTNKMFQDIISKQLTFPSQIKISLELKSLLTDLLQKNPKQRMGSRNGMLDILNHSWCKKIKLTEIIQQKITPAIKPNPFVMYFEQFNTKQQAFIKELQNQFPCESDENFKQFYYQQQNKPSVIRQNSTHSTSQVNIYQNNQVNHNIQAQINININNGSISQKGFKALNDFRKPDIPMGPKMVLPPRKSLSKEKQKIQLKIQIQKPQSQSIEKMFSPQFQQSIFNQNQRFLSPANSKLALRQQSNPTMLQNVQIHV